MFANNTDFNKKTVELLKKSVKTDKLEAHQSRVKDFLRYHKRSRGLLVDWDLGSGKTRVAVAIAESFKNDYNVKILTSKSLHDNMRDGIRKYISGSPEDKDAHIQKYYQFISLNAGNVLTKLGNIDEVLEEKLGSMIDEGTFEGSLVIVDEAHRLFNSIVRGSKNATKLYDLIMATRDIKLVFLTGTPIQNDPFELVPALNMLAGFPVMGDNYGDFQKYFIDPKFRPKVMDRMTGLVSYYAPKDKSVNFPRKLDMQVVEIPMSEYQYALYFTARKKERDQVTANITSAQNTGMRIPSVAGSFRMKSRQLSNFAPRGHIPRNPPVTSEELKEIPLDESVEGVSSEGVTGDTSPDYEMQAPKIPVLLQIIKSRANQIGIIYSQFLGSGLDIIARALEENGFSRFVVDNVDETNGTSDESEKGNLEGRYAVITGEIDTDERSAIIKVLNAPDNMHGGRIRLLLVSETGVEGLDLKNIRYAVAFEPFWNMARIDQFVARAVRYKSHIALPEEERDVQPYLFVTVLPLPAPSEPVPESIPEPGQRSVEKVSTEQVLWAKSIENKDKIDYFMTILRDASIDCFFNSPDVDACHICHPTDTPLYLPRDFVKDMSLHSPCKPLQEDTIQVSEIVVVDDTGKERKFSYAADADPVTMFNIHIYEYNPRLDAYVEIRNTHPLYEKIVEEVLKRS